MGLQLNIEMGSDIGTVGRVLLSPPADHIKSSTSRVTI